MSKENPIFFISYAHADKEHYAFFKQLFFEQMPTNWTLWTDEDILLGANWFEEIKRALSICDYGLLLLSGAFKNSTFIINNEFEEFDNQNKIIPVLLKPFDYQNEIYLSKYQIYLNPRVTNSDNAFSHTVIFNRNRELSQEESNADNYMEGFVGKIKIKIKAISVENEFSDLEKSDSHFISVNEPNKVGPIKPTIPEPTKYKKLVYSLKWIVPISLFGIYFTIQQILIQKSKPKIQFESFMPQPYTFVPPFSGQHDRDFNTHPGNVTNGRIMVRLEKQKKSIDAFVFMDAMEFGGDNTRVGISIDPATNLVTENTAWSKAIRIYSVPDSNYEIQDFSPTTSSELQFSFDSKGPKLFNMGGGSVASYTVYLDQEGDEAGTYTRVEVAWNKFSVNLIEIKPQN